MFKLFISGLLLFSQMTIASNTLIIGAAQWPGYTNEDGSGIYFELLKKVFPKRQHLIKTDSYNRTLHAFKNKKLDLIIGVFPEEVPQGILPTWHLDTEYPLVAFYNKKKFIINSIEDIGTSNTAWLRGYNFKRFINNSQPAYLVDDLYTGFDMLEKHRIDTLIDFEYNLTDQNELSFSVYEIMPARRVFIAFQNTLYGRELAAQFDHSMKILRDTGELLALFTTEYPHTGFEQFNDNLQKVIIYSDEINLHKNFDSSNGQWANGLNNTLNLVLDKMHGYKIEFRAMNSISAIFDQAPANNACFAYMIKTVERTRLTDFIFSEPFSISFGLRLFSKQKLIKQKKQAESSQETIAAIDLPKFFKNSPLSLGVIEDRSYGKQIDQQLALMSNSSSNMLFLPTGISSSAPFLLKNKVDALLEYPLEMQEYWPKLSKEKLYSYPIKNANKYVLGSLMCSSSALGKEFITQFNENLAIASKSNFFRFVHLKIIAEKNRAEMNRYFDEVFINK